MCYLDPPYMFSGEEVTAKCSINLLAGNVNGILEAMDQKDKLYNIAETARIYISM